MERSRLQGTKEELLLRIVKASGAHNSSRRDDVSGSIQKLEETVAT